MPSRRGKRARANRSIDWWDYDDDYDVHEPSFGQGVDSVAYLIRIAGTDGTSSTEREDEAHYRQSTSGSSHYQFRGPIQAGGVVTAGETATVGIAVAVLAWASTGTVGGQFLQTLYSSSRIGNTLHTALGQITRTQAFVENELDDIIEWFRTDANIDDDEPFAHSSIINLVFIQGVNSAYGPSGSGRLLATHKIDFVNRSSASKSWLKSGVDLSLDFALGDGIAAPAAVSNYPQLLTSDYRGLFSGTTISESQSGITTLNVGGLGWLNEINEALSGVADNTWVTRGSRLEFTGASL